MGLRLLSLFSVLLLPLASNATDCVLPFTQMMSNRGMPFSTQDVYNDLAGVKDMYRGRYVVVNLNTRDDNGNCKGVQEHYPTKDPSAISLLPELANQNDLQTYLSLPHYKAPISRSPVEGGLCLGQTVTMCELRSNGQVIEVAKLATSSLETGGGYPESGYYPVLSYINTRSWGADYQRPAYTAADGIRDAEMGGTESGVMSGPRLVKYNGWPMPNFTHFMPAPGYPGNNQNGFHELSRGETFHQNMGGPVSHGCLRLTKYGSVLFRWWVPRGARTFIHFTPEGYKKFAR